MPRPDLAQVPEWFHGYINRVEGNNLMQALKEQTPKVLRFLRNIPPAKRNYRYARGKWTIQEMLQHIIDAERVFAYRAMCIARKETVSLPSFDENSYADHSKAKKRDWDSMIEEFKSLRRSTELLFESFDKEQWSTVGMANHNPISVLAIGFILTGHVNHHIYILKERYLAS